MKLEGDVRRGLLGGGVGENVEERYVPERNSYSSVCSGRLVGHHKPQSTSAHAHLNVYTIE